MKHSPSVPKLLSPIRRISQYSAGFTSLVLAIGGLLTIARLGRPSSSDLGAATTWLLSVLVLATATYLLVVIGVGTLVRLRGWSGAARVTDRFSAEAVVTWLDRHLGRVGARVVTGVVALGAAAGGSVNATVRATVTSQLAPMAEISLNAASEGLSPPLLVRLPTLVRSSAPSTPSSRRVTTGGRLARATTTEPRLIESPTTTEPALIQTPTMSRSELMVVANPVTKSIERPLDGASEGPGRPTPPPGPPTPRLSAPQRQLEPPCTWLVRPGDHLWSIAERRVRAYQPDATDGDIAEYWLRLITANAAQVKDPDRIFAGQLIALPPRHPSPIRA